MLRSDYHEGRAEHRVGSCGIDAELFIGAVDHEIDKRTLGASYPVFLLKPDVREIIDVIEPLKELVGILGYAEIPHVL